MHPKTKTILDYIIKREGVTQKQLADITGRTLPQVGSAVATLRRIGFVYDVLKRCPECNGAMTRGIQNQKLYATAVGKSFGR